LHDFSLTVPVAASMSVGPRSLPDLSMTRFLPIYAAFLLVLLAGASPLQAHDFDSGRSKDPNSGRGSELKKFRAGVVSDAPGSYGFRVTVRDGTTSRKGIVRADATGNGSRASPSATRRRRRGRRIETSCNRRSTPPATSRGSPTWGTVAAASSGRCWQIPASIASSSLKARPPLSRRINSAISTRPSSARPEGSCSGGVRSTRMFDEVARASSFCEGGDGDCVTGSGTAWVLARDGDVVGGRSSASSAAPFTLAITVPPSSRRPARLQRPIR